MKVKDIDNLADGRPPNAHHHFSHIRSQNVRSWPFDLYNLPKVKCIYRNQKQYISSYLIAVVMFVLSATVCELFAVGEFITWHWPSAWAKVKWTYANRNMKCYLMAEVMCIHYSSSIICTRFNLWHLKECQGHGNLADNLQANLFRQHALVYKNSASRSSRTMSEFHRSFLSLLTLDLPQRFLLNWIKLYGFYLISVVTRLHHKS